MNFVNDSFWDFVTKNQSVDASTLRLKYHGNRNLSFDVETAIVQIECRKKFGKKLANTLEKYNQFIFPSVLAGEQATSDLLANYHASLIPIGSSILDLTAGLGIDALHIADRGKVDAIELDNARYDALCHNFNSFDNVRIFNEDCREYIRNYDGKQYDVAFIDPARRSTEGGRVFALSDCMPDVTIMLDDIKRIARRLVVKMSPMLDVTKVIEELPCCSKVIAVGTPTECRELVAIVDFGFDGTTSIESITLTPTSKIEFSYTFDEELASEVRYDTPQIGAILCEPYPSVMKINARKLFASRYSIKKLAPNSHVYFGDSIDDIPAELYRIVSVLPYSSKIIKRLKRDYPTANIATRNFPVSSDNLRSKLQIKDGGNVRIVGTTDFNGNPILIISNHLNKNN